MVTRPNDLPSHFILSKGRQNASHGEYGKTYAGRACLKCRCKVKNTLFTRWQHIVTISDGPGDAGLILTLDALV